MNCFNCGRALQELCRRHYCAPCCRLWHTSVDHMDRQLSVPVTKTTFRPGSVETVTDWVVDENGVVMHYHLAFQR